MAPDAVSQTGQLPHQHYAARYTANAPREQRVAGADLVGGSTGHEATERIHPEKGHREKAHHPAALFVGDDRLQNHARSHRDQNDAEAGDEDCGEREP